jgi:hypothetical protein
MRKQVRQNANLAALLAPSGISPVSAARVRWLLLILLAAAFAALAQRPPLLVPSDPQTVIEKLPRGYAALTPSAKPSAPAAPISRIQQLLSAAARTGDSRLAARAEALLAKFPAEERSASVLAARAFSAQHRHDFADAVGLLDALIQQRPRDGAARFARAQVNLVRGRLDSARADCVALSLGVDAGRGLLCAAALSLRTGRYPAAADLAERWLAQAGAGEEQRYALTMRGEIAARAGDGGAQQWFRRALALDADDVRTLAAYARYLRGAGRDGEVEALLAGKPDSDALHLQRTLAAHQTDPSSARALADAQAQRYGLAHKLGSQPELRDEAEFLLIVRAQPEAALALAQRNFQEQRDFEDVDLLIRAATAAGRPQALQPLREWAAAQKLSLPPIAGEAK